MKNKILFLLILLFATSFCYSQNIDSLFNIYQNTKEKKNSNTEEILINYFIDNELVNYQKSNKKRTRKEANMVIYYGMSNFNFYNDNYNRCIKYALESLNNTPDDSLLWKGDIYNVISLAYSRMGNFDKAIEYFKLTYQIDEKMGDEESMSSSLNNLAAFYLQNEQPKEAEKYIIKAIAIERKAKRNAKLAIRLGLYSDILLKLGRVEEAYTVIDEAITLEKEIGKEDKIAIRLSQMGEVLIAQKNWKDAKKRCTDALKVFEKYEMQNSIIICLRQLAHIEREMNNFEAAERYLLRCDTICRNINSLFMLQKVYYQLYELNKSKKPAEALHYFELSTALHDSIFSMKKQEEIMNFHVLYETREKEYQIEKQKSDLNRKTRQIITLLGIVVLLIIIITITLYLRKIQTTRNKELAEANNTKNKFLSIISHDLKNPAIAQKRMMDVICENYNQFSHEELQNQMQLIRQSTDLQYALVM